MKQINRVEECWLGWSTSMSPTKRSAFQGFSKTEIGFGGIKILNNIFSSGYIRPFNSTIAAKLRQIDHLLEWVNINTKTIQLWSIFSSTTQDSLVDMREFLAFFHIAWGGTHDTAIFGHFSFIILIDFLPRASRSNIKKNLVLHTNAYF